MKQTEEEDKLTPSYPWRNQELVKIQKFICSSQCSRIYIQDLIVAKFDFLKLKNNNEKTRKLGSEAPLWENPKQMRLFYKISYIVNLVSAVMVLVYYAFIILSRLTGELSITNKTNTTSTNTNVPVAPNINTTINTNTTNNNTTTHTNTTIQTNSTTTNTTTQTTSNITNVNGTSTTGKLLRIIEEIDHDEINRNFILGGNSEIRLMPEMLALEKIFVDYKNNAEDHERINENKNFSQKEQDKRINNVNSLTNHTDDNNKNKANSDIRNSSESLINNRAFDDNKTLEENLFKKERPKFGYFLQAKNTTSANDTGTGISTCLQEFVDFQGCGKKILQEILIIVGGLVLIVNSKLFIFIKKSFFSNFQIV